MIYGLSVFGKYVEQLKYQLIKVGGLFDLAKVGLNHSE